MNRLAVLRSRLGVSRADLADEIGVDAQKVRSWEIGDEIASTPEARAYLAAMRALSRVQLTRTQIAMITRHLASPPPTNVQPPAPTPPKKCLDEIVIADRYYALPELAALSGMRREYLSHLCLSGKIEAHTGLSRSGRGRAYYVPGQEVVRWLRTKGIRARMQ